MTDAGDVGIDPRALAALRREEDGAEVDVAGLVRTLRDHNEAAWTDALWRLRTRLYPSAAPALIEMIEDPTAGRVRTYAAELLGVIGGPAAADALRRAAESDQDELVRGMSAAALRDMETIGR
jgi:HEAT repeat protein